MIFADKLKKELIKTEVELIEIAFKINDKLGELAIKSACSNFIYFLNKGTSPEEYILPMNLEYRKFVIDLTKAIPSELLDKAMPVILGVKK